LGVLRENSVDLIEGIAEGRHIKLLTDAGVEVGLWVPRDVGGEGGDAVAVLADGGEFPCFFLFLLFVCV
jgi:hypothetical protein